MTAYAALTEALASGPDLDAGSWTLTLVLSWLCFGVLAHGLHKVRTPDASVAAAWSAGLALSVGTGLCGVQILALSGLDAGPIARYGLRLPTLAGLWLASMVIATLVLLLARFLVPRSGRHLLQAALLGLLGSTGWLQMAEALSPGLPLPTEQMIWPGLAGLVQALGAWLALRQTDPSSNDDAESGARDNRLRQWLGAGLYAAGTALALLTWQALPLGAGEWLAAPPERDWLPPVALQVLAVFSALMLLTGVSVSQIDRLAQRRRQKLARSLNSATEKLREQASVDPLTRLPNRLEFEEQLDAALVRADDSPGCLAVLFIDLDGFKPVNDSFGHVAGDSVLREMANRLRKAARDNNLVARVGGDEFLVLAERPGGATGAAAIARRLLEAFNQPCVLPNTVEVKLSCSIGVVLFPEHGPAKKLIACADAAMYAAKRAGGSTFAFFEPGMEIDTRAQLELQNDLRRALDNQELELYYQPKIDGHSGQVTGVEALMRWHHPTRGLIMPGVFIPVAERFGLISRMGDWVIEESCQQIAAWRKKGMRMRVAINVSAHQLRQEGLLQRLREAMQRHQVEPAQLTLEIIESVLMEDSAVQTFSGLASLGVGLSIDDFGIGYCNFALLRKMPVKQLKVDRSLFTDIQESADARSVVVAIVRMAHALNLRVVAEGVETEAQRNLLLQLECDELQGYLFARPMSATQLTLWAMSDDLASTQSPEFRSSIFLGP